jgi:hypothetical protein
MNWYWLLECFGIIALANAATLPWAWWLWRREAQPWIGFKIKDVPELAIHAAETSISLPSPKAESGTSSSTRIVGLVKRIARWAGGRITQSFRLAGTTLRS